MESLSEMPWDVVINGTGLQQSLLALALSRSKKRILHIDPNEYYGQHEAAFSLQEADTWVASHATKYSGAERQEGDQAGPAVESHKIFRNASIWKHAEAEEKGLSFPRAYSLALSPQIIHTRSKLLAQLVSSRAYRQVEFLAVGSFYMYEPTNEDTKLSRIPSSREDVFSTSAIPARTKRSLMKFLKFVIDYDSEERQNVWQSHADVPLADFLVSQFKLDDSLCHYVLALTLTLDGKITVKDGLGMINRHLTSMGLFGPGFCAVYPKWGGTSEIAQVACRAQAVGGGIYMLGTSMDIQPGADTDHMSLKLSNEIDVQTKRLVSYSDQAAANAQAISRLVAIVNTPFKALFETTVEGAPTPVAVVVAFPAGTIATETSPNAPIYAMVHSSDTGECPSGQSVIYLTTLATASSKQKLQQALDVLMQVAAGDASVACLYQLHYEQTVTERTTWTETHHSSSVFSFTSPPLSHAFDDSELHAVKSAWEFVMGDAVSEEEYMVFEDREGANVDDEIND